MKKTLLLCLVAFSGSLFLTVNAQDLPAGWSSADIGTVTYPGSATYDEGTGVMTLNGAGLNFWDTDDGHYAYVQIEGDFEIEVRLITFAGDSVSGIGGAAKAGIDVRNSLDTDAPSIMMAWEDWGGLATTARSGPGATPTWQGGTYPGAGAIPWHLKVTRIGQLFYTFESYDKSEWVKVDTLDFAAMLSTVYVGLALSTNSTATGTATFDSINITGNIIGTGINEQVKLSNSRTVYPNPVRENLFIGLNENEIISALTISDIRGAVVYKSFEGSRNNSVDVSSLVPGLYFLKVVTNQSTTTSKFLRK